MSASETGTVRPGLQVGPTSEFSLIFRVKPGTGRVITAWRWRHEARFVLFDDARQLAFI
jgi:hypothetical protein